MKSEKSNPNKPITLEQLLLRGDVWRGQSQGFAPQAALDTGHAELNARLLHQGWPLGSLVEICQPGAEVISQGEWLLLAPALRQLKNGYTVLLNPPALPFAPGLIQAGIDLDRLLIVATEKKADFLTSFTELARADICVALMAWQPKQNLNYTELRKCQLACSDSKGLYVLLRPVSAQQQSSPAALRLSTKLSLNSLEIQIFKQKAFLTQENNVSVNLTLPETWLSAVPPADLGPDTSGPLPHNANLITSAKRNLP